MIEDGRCFVATRRTIDATWRVEGDRVCLPSLADWQAAQAECYAVAVLLDRVGLFDARGALYGRGHSLTRGRRLADALAP